MALKTTLNATNLEALGAERLAELLIEISTGDAAIKRRLRLELASTQSPKEVAREVRKRLTSIARSRSFVDWQTRKALVNDLGTQRRAIVDKVAPEDPAEALDLMWRFTELAELVFDRCDDFEVKGTHGRHGPHRNLVITGCRAIRVDGRGQVHLERGPAADLDLDRVSWR